MEKIGINCSDLQCVKMNETCDASIAQMKDIIFSLGDYDFYIPPKGYTKYRSGDCIVLITLDTTES